MKPIAIALNSSNYEPCSIFICTITPVDDHNQPNELIVNHQLSNKHDCALTSFDWSKAQKTQGNNKANHGRIVTCGEDCRIFVWTFQDASPSSTSTSSTWTATQVLLQHNISSTPLHCKWDPCGERFVMGMGGNHKTASIEICSYESRIHGWSSRQIGRKKIKSSVLCVCWRPLVNDNNDCDINKNALDLVACGGCDYRCRIFCVNKQPQNNNNDHEEIKFGEQFAEFNTNGKGWVIGIDWSGKHLAFASHKSFIFIVDCSNLVIESWSQSVVPIIIDMNEYSYLPMRCIYFLDDDTLVTGGYDGHATSLKRCTRTPDCKSLWKINKSSAGVSKRNMSESPIVSMSLMKSPFLKDDEKSYRNSLIVSGSEGYFDMLQFP